MKMVLNAEADVQDKIVNYYDFFNLPVEYDIDEDKLSEAYINAQHAWNNESETEDNGLVYINKAYETLKDPIARGAYFLTLYNENSEKMCNQAAIEMFDMEDKYFSLKTEQEKEAFQAKVAAQKELMLSDLKKITDRKEFLEVFAKARFIDSFLKKVRSDVYNRN